VKLWFVLNAKGGVTQAGAVSGNSLLTETPLQGVQTWKSDVNSGISASKRYETEFSYNSGGQETQGGPKLTLSLMNFEHVEVSPELYTEAIP